MFLSSSFETCVVSGLFSRERKGGGGGREGLELIIHKGVSFTQQISSLVSICDAKAWSHKKEEKEKLWVCWMFWPLDCLYVLNRGWTLYKGWVTKSWLSTRSQFHSTNFFLSLNLWCKDFVPKKKEKEMKGVCWMFWPLDCLYALNREWTLYKRWVIKSWRTKESDSRPLNKSLP